MNLNPIPQIFMLISMKIAHPLPLLQYGEGDEV